MSKALKRIVAVAAAVAIPFAAPAIAQSMALSGLVGSIGLTGTSALVGAGLGAASSAVAGGNIGRGALMGGIGGGIGGYTATPATQAAAASSVPAEAITAANATADPIAALNASQGWTNVDPEYLASIGGAGAGAAMVPQQAPQAELDTEGLSGAMQQPSGELGTGLRMPGAQPVGGVGAGAGAGAYQAPTVAGELSAGLQAPAVGLQMPTQAATAASGAAPQTFAQALAKVPGQIAAKFTDPKALADMTLRAAGQLAGSALAGSGLSSEEQALLNAQTEELRTLQQTNADLFRQRLSQAQGLIGESRYFDPEYFGLQSARRAQIAGARAQRAGLRGLEGERRAAEARRFELATGRDVGTAYDVGFGTGVQGRLQTMQTGIGLMPSGYPSSMGDYSNLRQAYGGAAERQQQRQQQIGSLFGSLTGEQKAKKKGEEAV